MTKEQEVLKDLKEVTLEELDEAIKAVDKQEQEEAIERINNDIAKPLYCGDITICNIDDLKTILSMLEEQKNKISQLGKGQQTLIQSRRKWKNRYYKMKRKLKEKNKTIDVMAETISFIDTDIKVIKKQIKEKYCDFLKSDADYCWKTDIDCRDCIKQYFENKAKEYLKER